MPELPEVETVRRGLQPAMEGSKIVKAEARRKDLRFPFQKDFIARLEGQTFIELIARQLDRGQERPGPRQGQALEIDLQQLPAGIGRGQRRSACRRQQPHRCASAGVHTSSA